MKVIKIICGIISYKPHHNGYIVSVNGGEYIQNNYQKGAYKTPWEAVVAVLEPNSNIKHIYAKPFNKEDWL